MDYFKFTHKPYCILYIYVEFNYYFIIEETNIIKKEYIYIYIILKVYIFILKLLHK
jgi:hypothetical protein